MNAIPIYTVSLGCPKNRVDTERMLGSLGTRWREVDRTDQARVVLVNTCGFIAPAVEESVSMILELAAEIAEFSPRPLLAVTGCLVARYGQELVRELRDEVDLFLTIEEQGRWPELLGAALHETLPAASTRAVSTPPGYAYLKISEGCDNACRFCTIPSIRGRQRSWTPEFLEQEAATLIRGGVRELVVVGQDVTAYGRDLGLNHGLRTLVDRIAPLPGLDWLRLMYLYPAGLTRETLSFLASVGDPLLPYFDIPLQHAHPEILKTMGRPFANDPRRVVDRVRDYFPDAHMRTTFIVGYPGETETHFRALLDFVREVRFTHLGVFPYYAEDGTRAAAMDGQVPEEVKLERRDQVMELQAEISEELLAGYWGEEVDVLVDTPHEEWPTLFVGRTRFQAPEVDGVTYVSGERIRPGDLVRARVEETETYDLITLAEG
ncbi:MAG TPA: 30S ribosomal protein S12 methylthiotransferase RimO [Desulfomicrobiaceae bacterium]|nr:30S ribosomal protein S12 methylthiotransferase RimO [Desulfomicrobiaceae bacterium]